MISNQVLESSYITVLLRALLCEKFIPKLAKGTMHFLSTWMGKIMRCHRTIFGIIINRKARRIEKFEKRFKNDKVECDCPKCSKDRMDQRKRVISSDFLASLAYNHRVCNDNRLLKSNREDVARNSVTNHDDDNSSSRIWKDSRSNTKDVRTNNDVGQAWWASVLERREYMPPLEDSVSKQTESECCANPSGFGSNIETHLMITASSEKSIDERALVLKSSPTAAANLFHYPHRTGSKSEPRNLPRGLNRSLVSVDSCNCSRKENGTIVNKVLCRKLSFLQNGQRRRGSIRSGKWAFDKRWRQAQKNTSSSCPTNCVSTRVHNWASVQSCDSLF